MAITTLRGNDRTRPFGLLDAVALILGLAVSLGSIRICTDSWAGIDPDLDGRDPWRASFPGERLWLDAWTWGFVALTPPTIAFTALALRRPRPSVGELCRKPGFVAGAAVSAAWAVAAGWIVALLFVRYAFQWRLGFWLLFLPPLYFHLALALGLPSAIGIAVAACWALQWRDDRWRPDRGWLDRAGIALGGCWVALPICEVAVNPGIYLNPLRLPSMVGAAVASAWVVRRLGGRRPARRGRFAQATRVVGWLFVACFVAQSLVASTRYLDERFGVSPSAYQADDFSD